VEGGNALEFDSFYLDIAFGHLGSAPDGGNIAVVKVVMAYGNDVGRLINLSIVEFITGRILGANERITSPGSPVTAIAIFIRTVRLFQLFNASLC